MKTVGGERCALSSKALPRCRKAVLRLSQHEWPLVGGGSLRLLPIEEERELIGDLRAFALTENCELRTVNCEPESNHAS